MRKCKLSLPSSALILSAISLGCPYLSAQTAPAAPPSPPTVRVYTREVVVDINVADAQGKPVHGLTQADFSVLEDGRPVYPRSFREHRSDQQDAGAPKPAPALAPNTFANDGPPAAALPLDMLLFDATDTPIATQAVVRQRMAEFVDKLTPGTRLAVFGLSPTGQLTLVQGFTSDRDLLKKALKSHKLDLSITPLEDFGQEPTDNIAPPPPTTGAPAPSSTAALLARSQQVDLTLECNHAAARAAYNESALTQIARFTSGMPGRKNLIWFTGAFPTRMRDKQGSLCYDAGADMRLVDGLLEHSHVAVYPVDPRALDALARNDPTAYPVRVSVVEHQVMDAFAESTGGKAFYNTNDLAGAAFQAIDAGSNYYAVSYSPTYQNQDTRRHSINVAVDKPGLTLLYMTSYHAVPPGETTASSKQVDKATPLQSAMMRGTLEPSEILFQVGIGSAAATESALLPNNSADPKVMKPPYRHLTLSYLVDLNGIQFDPSPDGNYHGQFEYAVNVYDSANGRLLNSSALAAKPSLPPAAYQSMLAGGAKLHQEIDVPATGEYILRVGVHDLTTDHVGAIEIPASAIHP
jgi:VWFA-related protein